jgi:hypothetical protein
MRLDNNNLSEDWFTSKITNYFYNNLNLLQQKETCELCFAMD